jgi:hypothetical protein
MLPKLANSAAARPLRGACALALAIGIGSLWLSPAHAGTVYKWSDSRGLIHYSDLPPPPDGKLISIDNGYDRAPVARTAAVPPANPAGPPPAASDQTQLKKAVANDVASVHAEDCKKAQDVYQTYVRSRRLYREGPNKERVYLSNDELETERLNAKREVDEACAAAGAQ